MSERRAESSFRPRVKICGITREEDAQAAVAAGADAIGIVFYPPSKRCVSDLGLARAIAQAAGPLVNVVGLFVDAQTMDIERVLSRVPIATIQFHGHEKRADCEKYQRPYIRALRVKEGLNIVNLASVYESAVGILLDTFVAGTPGGTGQTFNWDLFPKNAEQHFILAGGLSAENVAQAVQKTSPYAVDVSGGVESSAGIKDHEKILRFINQAKSGLGESGAVK